MINYTLALLGHQWAKKALMGCVLGITLFAATWLIWRAERLDMRLLLGVAGVVLAFGIFTAVFTVAEIISRIETGIESGVSFKESVTLTYRGYFLLLTFVPVVGVLICHVLKVQDEQC